MDPTTWAWIGVVVGMGAVLWAIPTIGPPLRPFLAATLAMGPAVAVAITGALLISDWSNDATVAAVAGGAVTFGADWLGTRLPSRMAPLRAATLAGRLSAAICGWGLLAAAGAVLLVGPTEIAQVSGTLTAGAAAGVMVLRLGILSDTAPRAMLPEVMLLVLAAASSGWWLAEGALAVWPLVVVTVGVVAASCAGAIPVAADPTRRMMLRWWIAAVVVGGSGPLVATLMPPDAVRHPIGLGIAIAAGAAAALVVGELIRLYTNDRWRPAKRVASRARTGAAAVVTTGSADAARATGWLLAGLAAAAVTADRLGRLSDQHDMALVLAVAALTACLAALASGHALAVIAEQAEIPDDDAPTARREDAAHLVAAGSGLGAVGRGAVTVAALAGALILLLIALRRSAPDPVGAWAGVGALAGVAAAWYAVGWLSTTAEGDGGSPRRGIYAAALTLALPVVAVTVSPAAALGVVAAIVGCGGALAFWGGIAAGSWENVRRLIEAGAYGGVGSRAYRAVVAADTIGARWRGVIVPGLVSVIVAMSALVAVFSAG